MDERITESARARKRVHLNTSVGMSNVPDDVRVRLDCG